MTDDLFASQRWMTDLEGVQGGPPGMLGPYEASLLYHVTRSYYRGYGQILDLGAFLGSSSYCIARGLEANPRVRSKFGRLHAYDIFQVWSEPGSEDAERSRWLKDVFGIDTGANESTLGVYAANLGPLARYARVHAGDILNETWSGRPIEILFVDVAKSLSIWRHVLKTFYPSLIPGVSLVIHQDWHHPWLPYLHVAQEALSEWFEPVVARANDSVAYRLVDHIPTRVLDDVARYEFTPEEERRLMDRLVANFAGEKRFMLLASAALRLRHGLWDEASRLVHEALTSGGPHLSEDEAGHLRNYATGVALRAESSGLQTHRGSFQEAAYLAANPDIAEGVRKGHWDSGLLHWFRHGRWEGRPTSPV